MAISRGGHNCAAAAAQRHRRSVLLAVPTRRDCRPSWRTGGTGRQLWRVTRTRSVRPTRSGRGAAIAFRTAHMTYTRLFWRIVGLCWCCSVPRCGSAAGQSHVVTRENAGLLCSIRRALEPTILASIKII